MGKYIVGVDIGGTTSKIGIFSRKDFPEIAGRTIAVTDTNDGGDAILPGIDKAVRGLVKDMGLTMDDIDGIGLGVPGPVIRGGKPGATIVNKCVNLNWGVKDVAGEVSEMTGIENIAVINDANAAALGEVICGTDMEFAKKRGTYKNTCAVFVTIGTGVGGGIIVNGEVMTGAFGATGEIGHMKIAPQHEVMKDIVHAGIKPFGDLEYFVSATGISRVARAVLTAYKEDRSALRDYVDVDAKNIFDAAKGGDGLAIRITDFFFDTLGTGLAAIAATLDPDIFIIGGGVAGAGEFLLDGLHWAYQEHVFHASLETEFKLAELGNDAGMIGAAASLK